MAEQTKRPAQPSVVGSNKKFIFVIWLDGANGLESYPTLSFTYDDAIVQAVCSYKKKWFPDQTDRAPEPRIRHDFSWELNCLSDDVDDRTAFQAVMYYTDDPEVKAAASQAYHRLTNDYFG
ncbi:hypothetical protein [Paenibacillus chitinolyticus]|uniref:hypothetical protein n=1 Tax=Paenibacillus chitinolyticus TaxID=79263 RepID=UPI001C436916|nr:hypothetical protein [Paenibacillus chitinolyticus]MBV6717160.1 hypothetical protein [Paenibacillus chitinolyticus]